MSLKNKSLDTDAMVQPERPHYLSSVGSLLIAAALYAGYGPWAGGLRGSMPRAFRKSVIGFGIVPGLLNSPCIASPFFPGHLMLSDGPTSTLHRPVLAVATAPCHLDKIHLFGASYVVDTIVTTGEEGEPTAHELIRLILPVGLIAVGVWTIRHRGNRLVLRKHESLAGGSIDRSSIPIPRLT